MPEVYDDNGNLVSSSTNKEVYDDQGKLVSSGSSSWTKGGILDPTIPLKQKVSNFFFGPQMDLSGHKIAGPGMMEIPGIANVTDKLQHAVDPTESPFYSGARPLAAGVVKFLGNTLASGFDPRTAGVRGMAPVKAIGETPKVELPVPKQLGPAKDIQLPGSNLESSGYNTGTGKPAELLHANRLEPASEILPEDLPHVMKSAAESKVPEIQQAAQDVQKSGLFDRIRQRQDPFTIAADQLIQRQGPAGDLIATKITRASLKERMFKSQWKDQSQTALNLEPEEFEKAVDVVEGKAQPETPEIAQAAKEMSSVLNNAGQGLTESGITTKSLGGQLNPFQMRENYFPHYYPEGFWDRPDVLDKIVESGIPRDKALDMLQNRKKFGELLSPFQHQRIPTDLPGYLKSPDAYEQYINTAARRLAMAQELGPEDITGGPLNALIEKTTDPTFTTKILRRIIPGRDDPMSVTEQAIQPINNLATKLMAYTHLSRYAISRIAPSTEMIMQGGARNYISEIAKVLTDSGYANDIKAGTGVTENISNAMLDAVNKYPKNWLFGKSVDDFMRTVSGGMGRGLAQDLFQKLKANPNDLSSLKRLQNLIQEEPIAVVKNQDLLSKNQLNMAGARFSEITQGLPEARKVPLIMSEPLAQIPLIMKKYAFQHGAMLKNAIMQNPVKGIPLALGLTQLFGEGIGDAKAALKGVGSSIAGGDEGPLEKIANRGRFESNLLKHVGLPNDPLVGRLSDNFANAWIPFEIELLQSLGDKNGLVRAFGGPAIGDASDLVGGGMKELGKKVGQYFPVIGTR